MTVWLLKGLGAFCCSCGPSGRPIRSRARASSLARAGWTKLSAKRKKSAKSTRPAVVQVEAGIAAAEGLGEEEEVPKAGHAVPVEVRGGSRRGREGHRLQIGHGDLHGAGPRLPAQGQGDRSEARGVGGVRGGGEGSLAVGEREGDRGPWQRGAVLVAHGHDQGIRQPGADRAMLQIAADLGQAPGNGQARGSEGHGVEAGHGYRNGVRTGLRAQGQGGGGEAVGVGGGGAHGEGPLAGGHEKGDSRAAQRRPRLVEDGDDKGALQGLSGRPLLLETPDSRKGPGNRQGGGREGYRIDPGHRDLDGGQAGCIAQGQGGGSPAAQVGRRALHGEGPVAGGDCKGDLDVLQQRALLIPHLDDKRLVQGEPGAPVLLIAGEPGQAPGMGQDPSHVPHKHRPGSHHRNENRLVAREGKEATCTPHGDDALLGFDVPHLDPTPIAPEVEPPSIGGERCRAVAAPQLVIGDGGETGGRRHVPTARPCLPNPPLQPLGSRQGKTPQREGNPPAAQGWLSRRPWPRPTT